jgi:aspartate ammonia-lyase
MDMICSKIWLLIRFEHNFTQQPGLILHCFGANQPGFATPGPCVRVAPAHCAGADFLFFSANLLTMRQESDFLGPKDIPDNAYWGVHTARAVENFPITGHSVAHMPQLIRAYALVKKAAAHANLAWAPSRPRRPMPSPRPVTTWRPASCTTSSWWM